MNILTHVELIRDKAKEHGDYRYVAQKTGVNYHWLQKFACGQIKKPTVENVAKIEPFFMAGGEDL